MKKYLKFLIKRAVRIPENTLKDQSTPLEMPNSLPSYLIFEEFIETDRVRVDRGKLIWQRVTDWIEVTIGVVGKRGSMRALNPSITVASGNVLTVEEKFQGGTGVNITPPPTNYVSASVLKKFKAHAEDVARVVGLANYARIDAFLHVKTGDFTLIEVNTLPGLTPSTVFFHQMLAEPKPVYPSEFLEHLIDTSRK